MCPTYSYLITLPIYIKAITKEKLPFKIYSSIYNSSKLCIEPPNGVG